ncbi:MAG: hypothetical protein LBQ80_01210 [Clostridium sp.]|jgi:hypothetical protein|nr:hypothetical protein [Clostridium sp.]
MSAGFYVRTVFTILAGALIVLGVVYEEKLIAFEKNLAARFRYAWDNSFGESSTVIKPRPKNIQPRAVSYRSYISTQGGLAPVYAPERRKELVPAHSEELETKSA